MTRRTNAPWTIVASNCLAIALGLLACGCQPAAPQSGAPAAATNLLFGPYVSGVSAEGANVYWISRAGAGGSCRMLGDSAGAHVAMETAAIPGRTEVRHTARVTGLKADERHWYVVSSGKERAEGSFRTPPAEGPGKPFCFVVTGDTQSYPLRIRAGAEAIAREAPAFVVHTGDLCNNTQNWTLLEEQFFGPWRDLLRQAPFWPARGNHEYGPQPFASLFDLKPAQPWQSFDYGTVHVVLLDQWDLGPDSNAMEPERLAAMVAWLDKDLAAAKGRARWILVAGHQPMFNVAGHGSTWGHAEVLPLLYKHGVDVVVAGHSHLYERFVPIAPPGARPIQFIVAGGGGGTNYSSVPSPILVKSHAAPHFSVYRVFGDHLELTIKGPGGETIDYFVMSKTDGQVPAHVAAAALTPEDAVRLLKLCKNLAVEVADRPVGGRAMSCSLSPAQFPAGSRVKIASDPGSPWAVQDATFDGLGPPADANAAPPPPVALVVTPPPGVLLGEGQSFSPPLTVAVDLEYKGRHYACAGVPVGLTSESLRRLVPTPEVVDVPPAATAIVVDGNLAEWKDVPFLRLPSEGRASRCVKLAWRSEGLFGAVVAEQGDVHVDAALPWNADSLEINLEADARGRIRTASRGLPVKVFLWPQAGTDDGNTGFLRSVGSLPRGGVKAAWRKTRAGYAMEFCISARALTPPRDANVVDDADQTIRTRPLEAGRRIGLDLILRHDGIPVEQFAETRAFRSTWSSPLYWGRISLSE